MSTRILIVDDHQIMRDGLGLMLEKHPGVEVVGSCGDCAMAWRMAGELRPDLVLMDVDLPDGSGIALTRRMRAAFPELKVLVLTALLERRIAVDAIEAGAHGYLVKTTAAAEFLTAVRTVLAGGIHIGAEMSAALAQGLQSAVAATAGRVREALPLREGQVLVLIVRGLRNKEIAAELSLNVKTVETYRSRLMKRFNCASPAELVRHAIRAGLAVP
jgi:DNA-binding NarL/FixJ family response regulator